ncbi:hypothetical protein SAMN05216167_12099 [Spirosoma endophyticum]|uniref:Uncharacterized protein n=1 Tax=Spirosoma endophyticum TaxID=662367 RepID=A0A1I2DY55_9BACT|nr:hypothetical protein SAMN05216167_12099 [Spirosoma endophyticum]
MVANKPISGEGMERNPSTQSNQLLCVVDYAITTAKRQDNRRKYV